MIRCIGNKARAMSFLQINPTSSSLIYSFDKSNPYRNVGKNKKGKEMRTSLRTASTKAGSKSDIMVTSLKQRFISVARLLSYVVHIL